jgi:YfiH family protein
MINWTPATAINQITHIGPWQIKHIIATQASESHSLGIKQTHGNTIVSGLTLQPSPLSNLIEGDGIWIDEMDRRSYHIQTADCLPLAIVHHRPPHWACLLHVGWRGVAGAIVEKAIQKMIELGCIPSHLHAYGGPCLCPKHMEVEDDMRATFKDHQVIHQTCFWPTNQRKFLFNIRQAVAQQMIEQGMDVMSCRFSPTCTFESHELPSFRREGKNAGRLYTLISKN